jgi:signal transduction histidine kinase
VRFDDSLTTILSADMRPGVGAQSAWRQLVDLMSRGRIAADEPTLARLRLLRQAVPDKVRAASARAVAFATPGAALVGLFAEDVLTIAAPVLRTAVLPAADWLAILPRLTPETRSILRHRRDLPAEVIRGLESFGAADFVLGDATAPVRAANDVDAAVEREIVAVVAKAEPTQPEPAAPDAPPPDTPRSATPFVSLGDVARGLPVIAEALRQREDAAVAAPGPGFPIADLVKRIDAFQRQRGHDDGERATPAPARSFAFETDRDGVIRWIDGVARGPLIGVALSQSMRQGAAQVDAAVGGAIRQRARFAAARLTVGGRSDAAGSWRIAGEPLFDHATGRFTGYRGIGRRPRADETAAPIEEGGTTRSEALRQLVHELRTPTNAIAGFAELIETELLGPVAPSYRAHATTIREQASALIAAIDDLDTVARIEGDTLEQRPTRVGLSALVAGVARDLAPLGEARSATLDVAIADDVVLRIDDRLGERLFARLLAAMLTAAEAGEHVAIGAHTSAEAAIVTISRPRAFGDRDAETLMRIEPGQDDASEGASLLGIGFTLRLVRNLARELGGDFTILADRLTLRLPAAVNDEVGQAIN